MINKINESIFTLKTMREFSKKSKNINKKTFNLFFYGFSTVLTIVLTLITTYVGSLNNSELVVLFVVFFSLSVLLSLVFYGIINFFNSAYKKNVVKNIPSYIKSEIFYFKGSVFISKKKIKKINKKVEKMSEAAHSVFKKKYIINLSNHNIKSMVICSTIEKLSKEKLYSNLTYYFDEVRNIRPQYQDFTYECLMERVLNDLDYEKFNKNKKEIITCIENYFKEYEQPKYFKKLKEIRDKFDNDLIEGDINRYKKELLSENNKLKILKSI